MQVESAWRFLKIPRFHGCSCNVPKLVLLCYGSALPAFQFSTFWRSLRVLGFSISHLQAFRVATVLETALGFQGLLQTFCTASSCSRARFRFQARCIEFNTKGCVSTAPRLQCSDVFTSRVASMAPKFNTSMVRRFYSSTFRRFHVSSFRRFLRELCGCKCAGFSWFHSCTWLNIFLCWIFFMSLRARDARMSRIEGSIVLSVGYRGFQSSVRFQGTSFSGFQAEVLVLFCGGHHELPAPEFEKQLHGCWTFNMMVSNVSRFVPPLSKWFRLLGLVPLGRVPGF